MTETREKDTKLSRNPLRDLTPKRPRESGKRERQLRPEFVASALATKDALRAIIRDDEGVQIVEINGVSLRYFSYSIPLNDYSFDVKDSRKIAYEGIRRYGVEDGKYVRVPGTKSDDRRFSNVFAIARFARLTETDEGMEFHEEFPELGTILDSLPVILVSKITSDELANWDWDDENESE